MLATRMRAASPRHVIANSCDLELADSDALTNTFSTPTDTDKFTVAFWAKRESLSGGTAQNILTSALNSSGRGVIRFNTDDKLNFQMEGTNGVADGQLVTTATYGTGVWRHFMFVWDTGNAAAGNRMRIFVDGTEVTSFDTDTQPTQNENSFTLNTARVHSIGRRQSNADRFYDGLLAEFCFLDGIVKANTDDFLGGQGEPKDLTGLVYTGTNSFLLEFLNGGDQGVDTGNSNNWAEVNTPTQATDVPV